MDRDFLGIYAGLLVVPALLGWGWRWWAGRGRPTSQPLTAAEIGFLLGGRGRAADTAMTAALERGRMRVEDGALVATGRPSGDPLQRTVTESADGAKPDTVRWRLWDSEAVSALEAQLVRRGLLVSERRRRAIWPAFFAVYVALLLLGWRGCSTVRRRS